VRGGDLYYLFNESYEARQEHLRIPSGFSAATLLDPDTGEPLPMLIDGDLLTVKLGAVRGAILMLERSP
jgi:hypothetical protein